MSKPKAPPSADALALLAWAGVPWRRGPIPTGLAMVEPHLRRTGGWQSPRLPDLSMANVEAPAVWDRELTEAERSLRWCHLIDKHAAYLGVCGSLELGIAHPERRDRPLFERSTPGYWRLEVDPEPWPLALPDPLGRDMPRRRRLQQWYTTSTVELAIEQGIALDVVEAWVWPRHRRLLRPFYEACRRARSALEAILAREPTDRRRIAATAALRALKSIYAALLGGGFASSRDRRREPHPPWYRPDWRHAIIAKARANMLRNLTRWAASGVLVAAIYNDGAYVLADDRGVPSSAISLDRTLGGYSLKATWPSERMIGRRGRVVPSLAWGEDA